MTYEPDRIIWDRGRNLSGYNLVCKKCEGYKIREIFETTCTTKRKHSCNIRVIKKSELKK